MYLAIGKLSINGFGETVSPLVYRITGRVPRGRTEDSVFRDDETLRVSNHLTPRVNAVTMAVFS